MINTLILDRAHGKVESILRAAGLKVATQKYEYTSAGITHQGENIYGIIHAPRGDATEAIVLVAAWKTADDELNLKGVTLALTLARYFKREYPIWTFQAETHPCYRLVTMVKRHHLCLSTGQQNWYTGLD